MTRKMKDGITSLEEKLQEVAKVADVKENVVQEATQEIFENLISLDTIAHIVGDLSVNLIRALKNEGIMDKNLELTPEQADKLRGIVGQEAMAALTDYKAKINKDTRTKDVVRLVEVNIKNIIDSVFDSVSEVINKGFIVDADVVAIQTGGKDVNRATIEYSKNNGALAAPISGIFISSNFVKVIKDIIEVKNTKEWSDFLKRRDGVEPVAAGTAKELTDAEMKTETGVSPDGPGDANEVAEDEEF